VQGIELSSRFTPTSSAEIRLFPDEGGLLNFGGLRRAMPDRVCNEPKKSEVQFCVQPKDKKQTVHFLFAKAGYIDHIWTVKLQST
jgi:hypothetical protein